MQLEEKYLALYRCIMQQNGSERPLRTAAAAEIVHELVLISRRGVADVRSFDARVSLAEQSILMHIAINPGCRSTDIAAEFALNRSTVSRQLSGLIHLGLVVERGGAAGRGRPLELSAEGQKHYNAAIGSLQVGVDSRLAEWPDAEVGAFAEALARFNRAFDVAPPEHAPQQSPHVTATQEKE